MLDDDAGTLRFASTQWSQVIAARSADPEVRKQAVEDLYRRYTPALLAHLEGPCRLEPAKAEGIVSDFFQDKILSGKLLAAADPQKGRFRSLLLKALRNYLCDAIGRDKRLQPLADESWQEPAAPLPAPDTFDMAWARQVLDESLRRMRADCCQHDRRNRWELFKWRVALPILSGTEAIPYSRLVSKFQFASPEQASNALVNAKREFARILKSVVAEYTADGEMDSEMMNLREILAGGDVAGISVGGLADSVASTMRGPLESVDDDLPTVGSRISQSSGLFNVSLERDAQWSADDLMELCAHQLSQRLEDMLPNRGAGAVSLVERKSDGRDVADGSPIDLNGLFSCPNPPLELLDGVKRWARHAVGNDASNLPSEISSLIYFAAIAAALVRLGERITKSDRDVLRFGFQQMHDLPWIPSQLRELFLEALARLGNSSPK